MKNQETIPVQYAVTAKDGSVKYLGADLSKACAVLDETSLKKDYQRSGERALIEKFIDLPELSVKHFFGRDRICAPAKNAPGFGFSDDLNWEEVDADEDEEVSGWAIEKEEYEDGDVTYGYEEDEFDDYDEAYEALKPSQFLTKF